MQKILLVEDDDAIVRSLKEYLETEGFETHAVSGRAAAEAMLSEQTFELALVDLSLADGNGYDVCRAAKAKKLPVIFLTASADENSVVAGLDMGADDYISKPFRPRELVSRMRNVIRRSGRQKVTSVGNISVDTEKGIVYKNSEEVVLSALEYRLLILLINNRGRLMTRSKLLEDIWDVAGDFVNDNTLTVYIKRLREKIEDDPQDPQIIKTVRGVGYRVD